MRFSVLGPLEVRHGRGELDVGGRQPRLVLLSLLLARGRPVPADTLTDVLWGDAPPASATGTLQTYVSRLRRRLDEPDAPRISSDGAGYRLRVEPGELDLDEFERAADAGRELLTAERVEEARAQLEAALGVWRGRPFADLADHAHFTATATRLEERRLAALEDRIEADLRLGREAAVAAELAELVVAHPLRETLREKLALALYRTGRQAEALAALADAARTLRDELGLDPTPRLRDLEAAILQHASWLDRSPAAVAPVGGVDADAPAAPRRTGPPLVGRDRELAVLVEALDETERDAGFVVVEGDPGIGKTRLVDELRAIARSRGALAVWGRADESGASPALWPWLPILRTLDTEAAVSDAGTEPLAELVGADPSVLAGQGGAIRYERFERVAAALESIACAQPVVVLLDDLQWADVASLELLEFLATRLHRGVLVVATLRSLEVGRGDRLTDVLAALARRRGSRRLSLTGLGRDDIRELLPTTSGVSVDDAIADLVHERSEGNPFYALELARLISDEGDLSQGVPANVGDVIRRRLSRLPAETRELLTIGAVQGRDVDLPLLAEAAGLDLASCVERLEPALVHRCLVEIPDEPGALRFQHALIREVLVDGLTSLGRARLHLQVADAIERRGAGTDEAEILAEHLWRATPVGVTERAASALEAAAEVAVCRVAYTSAETLLRRAARLRRSAASDDAGRAAELSTLIRYLEVVLATRYFGGADEDVLSRALTLASAAGDADVERKLFWFRWAALSVDGRVAEATPLEADYFTRYSTDPRPEVRASAHEIRAVSHWSNGRIGDATRATDVAVALLRESPPPEFALDVEQQLVTWTFHLTLHAYHGDRTLEEVFAAFDELLDTWPAMAAPSICGFAATSATYLGRWDLVERYTTKALEADPASQFAFWGGQYLMQAALTAGLDGDVEGAMARMAEGYERYRLVGARSGVPTFHASLAMILAERGHLDEARALLAIARGSLAERPELWNEPVVRLAEAIVAHHAGDGARAAERLRAAHELAREQDAGTLVRRVERIADELGVPLRGDRTPSAMAID